MRKLIRWYRESPLWLRVVFGTRDGILPSRGDFGTRAAVLPSPSDLDGVADDESRQAPDRRRILVVCTGNVGRSPAVAGLLRARLDDREWEVLSAGTNVEPGAAASRRMCTAAAELGIDLSGHRARRVTATMVGDAELVIAMSQHDVDELLVLQPRGRRRIRMLGAFGPPPSAWGLSHGPRRPVVDDEIPDPTGRDLEAHRDCCRRLQASVDLLARWIVRRDASRAVPRYRPPISAPSWQSARLR